MSGTEPSLARGRCMFVGFAWFFSIFLSLSLQPFLFVCALLACVGFILFSSFCLSLYSVSPSLMQPLYPCVFSVIVWFHGFAPSLSLSLSPSPLSLSLCLSLTLFVLILFILCFASSSAIAVVCFKTNRWEVFSWVLSVGNLDCRRFSPER